MRHHFKTVGKNENSISYLEMIFRFYVLFVDLKKFYFSDLVYRNWRLSHIFYYWSVPCELCIDAESSSYYRSIVMQTYKEQSEISGYDHWRFTFPFPIRLTNIHVTTVRTCCRYNLLRFLCWRNEIDLSKVPTQLWKKSVRYQDAKQMQESSL